MVSLLNYHQLQISFYFGKVLIYTHARHDRARQDEMKFVRLFVARDRSVRCRKVFSQIKGRDRREITAVKNECHCVSRGFTTVYHICVCIKEGNIGNTVFAGPLAESLATEFTDDLTHYYSIFALAPVTLH